MALPLLTAHEAKAADALATERYRIDAAALMEQAAAALVQALERRFATALDAAPGLVVAGTGNNGADALALARLLLARGRTAPLTVVVVGEGARGTEGFRRHERSLQAMGATFAKSIDVAAVRRGGFVVDGLFGTGLSRPVEGEARAAIDAMNARGPETFLLAVDVPSGLSADTGKALGAAVRADHTVTFGFAKRGLFTGDAADHVGTVTVATIGIPRGAGPDEPGAWRVERPVPPGFPRRRATSHKGDFGFVECVLGDRSMHGAAVLAGTAALRSGAGRAALRGDASDLALVAERVPPDLMLRPLPFDFPPTTVVVAGPGWGRGDAQEKMLDALLASPNPLVLDADALALLPSRATRLKSRGKAIVLPHPKEAAALLGLSSVEEVEKDRFQAVRALADRYGTVSVLKGRGTLVAAPAHDVRVVDRGGPALAKGGTGDVLAGIVAALWAGAEDPFVAATNAVWLHGYAGERWEARGHSSRSMLPSDLVAMLPDALAEVEHGESR